MIDTQPHPDARASVPTVEVRWPRPDVAQVVLEGEHDIATHEQLDAKLAFTLANCSHLVVDLSTTQFIDSSTIRVLVTSKKRADDGGRRFNLLLGTEPIVERALEISGVLPVLNRVHALEEAFPTSPSTSGRVTGVLTVPKGGLWVNKIAGTEFGWTYAKREQAIAAGRARAMQERTEHVIHNQDGVIGERNSFGSDSANRAA